MRPNPHKYHYLPERERIKRDPRLEGFWALGVDTVSEVQECMAGIWRDDTTFPLREKQGVDMPLHWLLTQKLSIDHTFWADKPEFWQFLSEKLADSTDEDALPLEKLLKISTFFDLIFGNNDVLAISNRYTIQWALRSYLFDWHPNIAKFGEIMFEDFNRFGAADPLRNWLVFEVLGRESEVLSGSGMCGYFAATTPNDWDNPPHWSRDEQKQAALVRETVRFFDYALPVLRDRFGEQQAIEILTDEHQGLLNFWLTRNAPELAKWLGAHFQKYHNKKCLDRVHIRQPFKRLPRMLIALFGTAHCPIEDAVHVCLGRSLRDLPSVQPGEGQPPRRLSARAAHIWGQMEPSNYGDSDYLKDLYRAICLSIWPNDRIAESVAHFYENRGLGEYFDPFLKEMVLFFKRNETEMGPGLRTGHLIDYLHHEKQARPDFSLKGRTIASMVRRMDAWHRELWQLKYLENKAKNWLPSTFSGFEGKTTFVEGEFEFVQILDQHDLIEEGREMRHCVASYVDGCIAGNYSIWSLRKKSTLERLLTLQINQQGSIVQACGPHNRSPEKHERQLLKDWAKTAGLKLDYR